MIIRDFNPKDFIETSVTEDYEEVKRKLETCESGFTPYEHWLYLLHHDELESKLISAEKIDIALFLHNTLGLNSDDLAFNVLRMVSGVHQVVHIVMETNGVLCDTYHFLTYNSLALEIGSYKEELGVGFISMEHDFSIQQEVMLSEGKPAVLKHAWYPYGGDIFILGIPSENNKF